MTEIEVDYKVRVALSELGWGWGRCGLGHGFWAVLLRGGVSLSFPGEEPVGGGAGSSCWFLQVYLPPALQTPA